MVNLRCIIGLINSTNVQNKFNDNLDYKAFPSYIYFLFIESVAPSQVPYRSCKFTIGTQSTARCSNYNTMTSRMESEYAVEQTGMPRKRPVTVIKY